jgi:hypothetical protein
MEFEKGEKKERRMEEYMCERATLNKRQSERTGTGR